MPADAFGNASITVTPTRFTNTVTSLSAGGNIGDAASVTFNSNPAGIATDNDLTGDAAADLLTVGSTNGLPAGMWLAQGRNNGQVKAAATDIGATGNGIVLDNKPANFDGARIISGHFTGTGLQDVLAYYPAAGTGVVLNSNGDGSAVQAQFSSNAHAMFAGTLTDNLGNNPAQIANAGNSTARGLNYPDLIAASGDAMNGYYLDYYPNLDYIGGYPMADQLAVNSPDGTMDWDKWTITTAQLPTGTAMFLWNKTTGALYLWTGLAHTAFDSDLPYTSYTIRASGWNTGAAVTLQAADLNGEGTPDLWTVGAGAVVTGWLLTNLTTTPTLTAQPAQTLLTANHTWALNDANSGTVTTAADSTGPVASPLTATGAGSAVWNAGDQFDPDVSFNGTSSVLTTTSRAVATNADFTVSLRAKPIGLGGTLISQDGATGTGFKLWPESTDASWRFALSTADGAAQTWDVAAAAAGSARLGVWTHLTAVYNHSTGLVVLYINGMNVANVPHNTSWNATGPVRLGSGRASSYYQGQLSNVQTWSQTLDMGDDFASDGKADIFGRNTAGDLWVFPNTGGTGLQTFPYNGTQVGSGWTPYTMATGDITGDRRVDVVGRDSTGALYLYPNTGGTGMSTFGVRSQIGVGWNGLTFFAGDITGDGKADVLARDASGQLLLYTNTGGSGLNTFTSGGTTVGVGWNDKNVILAADLNGDGKADILARDSSRGLWQYTNLGGTGLSTFTGSRTNVGTGWSSMMIATADMNGDGKADIVARDSSGGLWQCTNLGGTGLSTFTGSGTNIGVGWGAYTFIGCAAERTGQGRSRESGRTGRAAFAGCLVRASRLTSVRRAGPEEGSPWPDGIWGTCHARKSDQASAG